MTNNGPQTLANSQNNLTPDNNGYTNSGMNGQYQYTNTTTTTMPNNIIYYPTTQSTINITPWTFTSVPVNKKYLIMKLSIKQKKMPESVFINGSLVSLGIFGSDVDCAFAGDALIFDGQIFNITSNGKVKIALYYRKYVYHYKAHTNLSGIIDTLPGTNYISVDLLSEIRR